jgi:DeoR/GlpR family transcriptional regulator of sugar metabolism
MTPLLVAIPGLTVVTNSTTVADAIATLDPTNQVSVILTGGVRTPSAALVGPVADRTIATMHVDQLFLGVHGMDEVVGFTTPNLAEAATDRALIADSQLGPSATRVLRDRVPSVITVPDSGPAAS